jgi:hypothetical protein
MFLRLKHARIMVLIAVPLIITALWLVSGREVFTKSAKSMSVVVHDELFGDQRTEIRLVPGPLLGYYVGLDLVVVSSVAAAAVGTAFWLLDRRRAQRRQNERRLIP